jgi:hypothetical protein
MPGWLLCAAARHAKPVCNAHTATQPRAAPQHRCTASLHHSGRLMHSHMRHQASAASAPQHLAAPPCALAKTRPLCTLKSQAAAHSLRRTLNP